MATGMETTEHTQRCVSCCLYLRLLLDASAVKNKSFSITIVAKNLGRYYMKFY